MTDHRGNWIVFNGEIYNFLEIKNELGVDQFRTKSDTEVILFAYRKWGVECLKKFRGMFAFALWDEEKQALFLARDRFGIKPLYYFQTENHLYFSSEIKTLLPFISSINTDLEGIRDYLAFQFCLNGKTLFQDIKELEAGHLAIIKSGKFSKCRYWDIFYKLDLDHKEKYFEEKWVRT